MPLTPQSGCSPRRRGGAGCGCASPDPLPSEVAQLDSRQRPFEVRRSGRRLLPTAHRIVARPRLGGTRVVLDLHGLGQLLPEVGNGSGSRLAVVVERIDDAPISTSVSGHNWRVWSRRPATSLCASTATIPAFARRESGRTAAPARPARCASRASPWREGDQPPRGGPSGMLVNRGPFHHG